jgi:hypothetical protein
MHLLALPSCLLQLVFARDVLAWPDSSIAPRAVPERMNALLQTGLASLRHLYPQISQGRLNAWELVQVMAWCSLLPGFWYLQRTRREGISLPWSSRGRQRGLPGAKSIDKEGKSSTLLYSTLLTRITLSRSRNRRPRALKEALRDTIIYYEPIHIPLSTDILSQTPTGRKTPCHSRPSTSPSLHTRTGRIHLSIPLSPLQLGQFSLMPINRPTRLWLVGLPPNFMGCVYNRSVGRTAGDRDRRI